MSNDMAKGIMAKVVALAMSVCLVAGLFPAVSWGALTSGTVAGGSGWTFDYSVDGGEATITGYRYSGGGTTDLTIPSEAGGAPVKAIGESAFRDCGTIAKLELPDSVERVEANAFRNTSATSVSVGKGLKYARDYAFANNAKMASFAFDEAAQPEFFGECAFAYDTALTEFTVPPLDGKAYPSLWYDGRYRIGAGCFSNCTALQTVVFRAGAKDCGMSYYNRDGGNATSGAYEVFQGCPSSVVIVSYLKLSTGRSYVANEYAAYYAVNFYKSVEAARADDAHVNPDWQILVAKGSNLVDIVSGKLTSDSYYAGSKAAPKLSDLGVTSSSLTWGVSNSALSASTSTLTTSLEVYPVNKGDMSYAYVTSPQTDAYGYNEGGGNQTLDITRPNSQFFRLRANGTVDLSDLTVRYADGTVVPASKYTLKYWRVTGSGQATTSTALKSAAAVNAAGTYYVSAYGKGAYSDKSTSQLTFRVRRYDGEVLDCTSGAVAQKTGKVTYAASSLLDDPKFIVMAPTSSWQACLVATACAGVGGGLALFSDGGSNCDATFQSIVMADVDYLIFAGATNAIGMTAIDRAKALVKNGAGVYSYWTQSDPAALAVTAYNNLKKSGAKAASPYAWGTTAILMSGKDCQTTAAVAQYAYQMKAPVFFTSSSGTVSSDTLAALKNFKKIVIAGSTSSVSASVATKVKSSTGVKPSRIMTSPSAYEASAELAKVLQSSCGDTTNAYSVVSAGDPVCAFAAAQYAALHHGLTFACASTAETKKVQAFVGANGPQKVDYTCFVGDFSTADKKVVSRVTSAWGKPLSTALAKGDTLVSNGVRYKFTSAKAVTATGLADTAKVSVNVADVAFDGKTYTTKAIAASAFSGAAAVKGVTVGNNVSKIGASAFNGCKKLTTLTVSSAKLTKSGVKNSLKGSSVKTVKLSSSAAKKKLAAYKGYFAESNSGKSVTVK